MNHLDMFSIALDDNQPMPPPRRATLAELPAGQTERYYLEQFMGHFGADWNGTAALKDKSGNFDLAVSRQMFVTHNSGDSKTNKRGRAAWLLYVAEAILNPDEIRLVDGDYGSRMLYLLARFVVRSNTLNILAVFREDGAIWGGVTGYQTFRDKYFETKRNGVLVYRRAQM